MRAWLEKHIERKIGCIVKRDRKGGKEKRKGTLEQRPIPLHSLAESRTIKGASEPSHIHKKLLPLLLRSRGLDF